MYSYGGFQNFNMALKKRVWAVGPPGETVDAGVASSARFCAHAHVTLAGICHQSKRASILGRPFLMMIS